MSERNPKERASESKVVKLLASLGQQKSGNSTINRPNTHQARRYKSNAHERKASVDQIKIQNELIYNPQSALKFDTVD